MSSLTYKPGGSILKAFMKDESFVRGIRGPVGSGKSAGCAIEIFRRASQQEKNEKGIRQTKWAVIRNTNPELRTTTIATWLQWFPEDEWGQFRWSPPYTHRIQRGDVDMEVLFLPLDTPEDIKKLLSLELTGAWINEAREVPKPIIDACTMRVGRFPSIKDGVPPTWTGVIMDTNAPEEDHWWPIVAGEVPLPEHISTDDARLLVKPDNWAFFNQPSAMTEIKDDQGVIVDYEINPLAENIKNLPETYYPNMIRGKTKSWIDVYVMNRVGIIEDGKAVYQGFSEKTHVVEGPIEAGPMPIYCGIDFGLTPSAVFAQRMPNGRWFGINELVCQDMGMTRFAPVLNAFIQQWYPEHDFLFYGDPSGDFRAGTDETTPFQILHKHSIKARPAPSNDPVIRIESVNNVLSRMVDGDPGLVISRQNCPILVSGFLGGYRYRRMKTSREMYDDRPDKNKFSHPHDAFQYMMLGGGEGRELLRNPNATGRSFVVGRNWNPKDRNRGSKRNKGKVA